MRPHHGFTLETETAASCALLQKHAPTIRNAFHRVSSYALARRWFPSHRRRTHIPEDEPKLAVKRDACARRPRHHAVLGTAVSVLCTDSLDLASWPPSGAFPGSSSELDRAYSACLATSERHDRDASDRLLLTRALTHENPLRRVLPNIYEAFASRSPHRAWRHREPPRSARVLPLGDREECTGRLGPADARGRGNARFTTRVFASVNRHGTRWSVVGFPADTKRSHL
jgi:hypothetical protein